MFLEVAFFYSWAAEYFAQVNREAGRCSASMRLAWGGLAVVALLGVERLGRRSIPDFAPVAQIVEHSVFHRGGVGSYPTRSNTSGQVTPSN